MEVELLSNETIKPSSPTPNHLRRYKLSFLDQITPRSYNPFIYYYQLNDPEEKSNNIASITDKLKKSLSQTLTLYYPLAGRFIDDRFLDCNDEGIPFFEARVINKKLSDVLDDPIPTELNKLLRFELDDFGELLLGVRLNVFSCGGIAIGVCISHGIADALSGLVFVQAWMAVARGENDAVERPQFISSDLFPPKNMRGYDTSFLLKKKSEILTKMFVFDASKIEFLRKKYSGDDQNRPSRIEALSTFMWSRFEAAIINAESQPPNKLYVINHTVNIRPKFDPPLPDHSFGNLFRFSTTPLSDIREGQENSYSDLPTRIREEIRKVDYKSLETLRSAGDEIVDLLKEGADRFVREEVFGLGFTSLCRFPLYEADFGIGKPTWVSSAASRFFNNVVGLMDDKNGDGIEAYVSLKPEDMARLEADEEFSAFVLSLS